MMLPKVLIILLLFSIRLSPALSATATGVFIPSEYTYLLPSPFQGLQAVSRDLSSNYINTVTSNATINALFAAARNATYYALDQEFYEILGGETPDIELVEERVGTEFAFEGGTWDYDNDQVWFTSFADRVLSYVSILNLETNTITTPDIPALHDVNPNGAYYFNGTIYIATLGNQSVPTGAPSVYAVDPRTYEATPILNSWFGEQLPSVDDLVWVRDNSNNNNDDSHTTTSCTGQGPQLFFSASNPQAAGYDLPGLSTTALTDAIYRYSPSTQSLQGVISRADITFPNGVRADATGQYLYVTGEAAPFNASGGSRISFGSSVIYRFNLDGDCFPVNKRLLATVRSYADGLHIDDYGRVWTGEYDGIVVRSPRGKVLGVFNYEALIDEKVGIPAANFALAGDRLVVLAVDRVWVVRLGQNVTSAEGGLS